MPTCDKCGTTWLDVKEPTKQSPCPMCEVERLQEVLALYPQRDGKPLVPGPDPGDGTAERLGVCFKFRAEGE